MAYRTIAVQNSFKNNQSNVANSPPQIAPDILRTGAVLLALLGTVLLCVAAALRWGWVRLPLVSFESGLVVAGVALFVGFTSTVAATLIALAQRVRAVAATSSRWLLVWCCGLLLGFAAVCVQ
jgi:hypothetical protein